MSWSPQGLPLCLFPLVTSQTKALIQAVDIIPEPRDVLCL